MNRRLEELSMNAWPSLRSHHYDGWLLRYANRYTKRANSIYPLYGGEIPLKEKLSYCEHYYRGFEMPTTFKLHEGEHLHELDIFLEDNGYHVLDPTDVLVMDLKNPVTVDGSYRIAHGYSEEWANQYAQTIGIDNKTERGILVHHTLATMLQSISPPSFYVFIHRGDEVVGSGNGVVEDGWLGVFNVSVKPAYRRQGIGRLVMQALLLEGQKLGAIKTYLQVVCNNEAASNLYTSLGYKKAYRYWYRRNDTKGFYL